jgi:hypothetical protein
MDVKSMVISGASGPGFPVMLTAPFVGRLNIYTHQEGEVWHACPLIVPPRLIFGGCYNCNQHASQR